MRTSVVLPAPFGPSRPKTMPSGTSRSTPARAVVDPNRLTTPATRTAGGWLSRLPIDVMLRPCHAGHGDAAGRDDGWFGLAVAQEAVLAGEHGGSLRHRDALGGPRNDSAG